MIAVMPQGWDAVAEDLTSRFDTFQEDALAAGQEFSGEEAGIFRDEQLSGRNGMDMHLNKIRGVTHDAVQGMAEAFDALITVSVFTPPGVADHITLHQTGTDRLKKRLTLDEHFEGPGFERLSELVEKALEKVAG